MKSLLFYQILMGQNETHTIEITGHSGQIAHLIENKGKKNLLRREPQNVESKYDNQKEINNQQIVYTDQMKEIEKILPQIESKYDDQKEINNQQIVYTDQIKEIEKILPQNQIEYLNIIKQEYKKENQNYSIFNKYHDILPKRINNNKQKRIKKSIIKQDQDNSQIDQNLHRKLQSRDTESSKQHITLDTQKRINQHMPKEITHLDKKQRSIRLMLQQTFTHSSHSKQNSVFGQHDHVHQHQNNFAQLQQHPHDHVHQHQNNFAQPQQHPHVAQHNPFRRPHQSAKHNTFHRPHQSADQNPMLHHNAPHVAQHNPFNRPHQSAQHNPLHRPHQSAQHNPFHRPHQSAKHNPFHRPHQSAHPNPFRPAPPTPPEQQRPAPQMLPPKLVLPPLPSTPPRLPPKPVLAPPPPPPAPAPKPLSASLKALKRMGLLFDPQNPLTERHRCVIQEKVRIIPSIDKHHEMSKIIFQNYKFNRDGPESLAASALRFGFHIAGTFSFEHTEHHCIGGFNQGGDFMLERGVNGKCQDANQGGQKLITQFISFLIEKSQFCNFISVPDLGVLLVEVSVLFLSQGTIKSQMKYGRMNLNAVLHDHPKRCTSWDIPRKHRILLQDDDEHDDPNHFEYTSADGNVIIENDNQLHDHQLHTRVSSNSIDPTIKRNNNEDDLLKDSTLLSNTNEFRLLMDTDEYEEYLSKKITDISHSSIDPINKEFFGNIEVENQSLQYGDDTNISPINDPVIHRLLQNPMEHHNQRSSMNHHPMDPNHQRSSMKDPVENEFLTVNDWAHRIQNCARSITKLRLPQGQPFVVEQETLGGKGNEGSAHPEKISEWFQQHGFTKHEWMALWGGGHSVGGVRDEDDRVLAAWTDSPQILNNSFFKHLHFWYTSVGGQKSKTIPRFPTDIVLFNELFPDFIQFHPNRSRSKQYIKKFLNEQWTQKTDAMLRVDLSLLLDQDLRQFIFFFRENVSVWRATFRVALSKLLNLGFEDGRPPR